MNNSGSLWRGLWRVGALGLACATALTITACDRSVEPPDAGQAPLTATVGGSVTGDIVDALAPIGQRSAAAAGAGDGSISTQATHTIRFRVTNASGQLLKVTGTQVQGRWREGQQPRAGDLYDTPEIHDFNTESTAGSTAGLVEYEIGNSGHILSVQASNPLLSGNTSSCRIIDRNNKDVKDSGLNCQRDTGTGNDMNASFVLQPNAPATKILTDVTPISRRDAIDGLCRQGSEPKYVTCKADTLDNVAVALGKETIVSRVMVNCAEANATEAVEDKVTVGETNTVGITLESQLKFSELWTQKIAGTYSHSWTNSRSTSYKSTLTVPVGQYGWIGMSSQLVNITGDYTLTAGNQTYKVNDVTIAQPADGAWVKKNGLDNDLTVARSYPLPDKDAICEGRDGRFWQPKPATIGPGKIFTIAVHNHNQWTISVPGRSHASGQDLQLDNTANARGRNQRWTFLTVPGQPTGTYQISSDNTPIMCMDVRFGLEGTDVDQFECKAAASPSLANQLWQPVYDPGTGSYEFVQPARGKLLSRTDNTLSSGTKIVTLPNPNPAQSRWTLEQ